MKDNRKPAQKKNDQPYNVRGHKWSRTNDGWNLKNKNGETVKTMSYAEWLAAKAKT